MLDPIAAHRPRVLVGVAVVGLCAVLVTGCGASGGEDGAASTTTRRTTTTTSTTVPRSTTTAGGTESGDDGCPSADAVGGLVQADVRRSSSGGGESSTDGPDVSYTGCAYRDDGEGHITIVRLSSDEVTSDLFAALDEQAKADDLTEGFVPVDGIGDAAYRDGTEIVVKAGGTMLFVSGGSPGSKTPSEDTVRARKLAKALATAGLAPDALDCDALAPKVAAVLGPVESSFGGSGSIVVDEVTLDTKGCNVDLADGTSASVNVAPSDQWDAWAKANEASSFTVAYSSTTIGERAAFDDGDALVVDDGDQPLRVTTEGFGAPEDEAALRVRLAELALGS